MDEGVKRDSLNRIYSWFGRVRDIYIPKKVEGRERVQICVYWIQLKRKEEANGANMETNGVMAAGRRLLEKRADSPMGPKNLR